MFEATVAAGTGDEVDEVCWADDGREPSRLISGSTIGELANPDTTCDDVVLRISRVLPPTDDIWKLVSGGGVVFTAGSGGWKEER